MRNLGMKKLQGLCVVAAAMICALGSASAARGQAAGKFNRDVNLPLVVEALAQAGIVRLPFAEGSVSGDERSLRAVA